MKRHLLFIIKILMVTSLAICFYNVRCQEIPEQEETVAPHEENEMSETFNKTVTDTPTCRMVPDSVPSRLKNEKAFAYANDATLWTKKEKKESDDSSTGLFEGIERFLQSRTVRVVFYLVVALAVIWIIYRLVVVNNLFVFSSRKKISVNDEEELPETEGKIRERIEAAVHNGDYRLATRLLYIETLQWLDQLQMIRYQADATNQQYVQQMDRTDKGREFRQLTRVFDYVWYGKFPVSSDKFEVIRKNFKAFNQSARS